jgi:histone arginine demethylase JMJD6
MKPGRGRATDALPRLPTRARVILQRAGETVFLPAGWWHVVLNLEEATAISCSLALSRDVERLWPVLEAEDPDLAAFWRQAMNAADARASIDG